eukprot:3873727-Amphidinium_carterae.1
MDCANVARAAGRGMWPVGNTVSKRTSRERNSTNWPKGSRMPVRTKCVQHVNGNLALHGEPAIA